MSSFVPLAGSLGHQDTPSFPDSRNFLEAKGEMMSGLHLLAD